MNATLDNMIVRRLAAGDLARVMEIAASLKDAPHWPEAAYLATLDSASTPSRIALVVSVAGEVSGFAIASLILPQAELETIAVAAGSQGRGAGRRLFDALAAELRSAAVREVLLEVRASNRTAIAFYRALGFGGAGQRRSYYADPVEDAVLMQLRLS